MSSNYEIGDPIKSGGFGSVYKSKCLSFAIKKICIATFAKHLHCPICSAEELHKRLKQELAMLEIKRTSPYVVKYFDYFPKDEAILTMCTKYIDTSIGSGCLEKIVPVGDLCIVMELCHTDLCNLIKERKSEITLPVIHDIWGQVLTGLEFLHRMKIIHRDLRPSNVLINVNENDMSNSGFYVIVTRNKFKTGINL